MAELGQRLRQMVDRVVGHRHRAVAALVPDLNPKIDHELFGHLYVVRDHAAAGEFAPAAFVQAVLAVNPVAVIP